MAPVDRAPVVGYTDRLSARPGERLTVHAGATSPEARVRVLRVDHDGAAPVRTPVDVPVPDRVAVPHQRFDHGSYGVVPRPPALGTAVTFTVWVWPTALPADRAGLLSQGDARRGPHAELALLADGTVEFAVRTVNGVVRVPGPALRPRRWYLLVGGYGPAGTRLEVRPRARLADEDAVAVAVATTVSAGPLVAGDAPLLFAARRVDGERVGHFDGKLDGPTVFTDVPPDVDEVFTSSVAWQLGARAHWDLSRDLGGDRVLDVVDGRNGTLVNHPRRGVTGHDWAGGVLDWRQADGGYAAVLFHSDDLADCAPVLEVRLPDDLPGGCYAVELTTAEGVARLPFFVRPTRRTARLAVLVPTSRHLADALDHLPGTRDDPVFRYTRSPHRYGEDLHLVGWLRRQGFAFDVLTDHDLHAEGAAALEGYAAVVTGSHPEHWAGAVPGVFGVDRRVDLTPLRTPGGGEVFVGRRGALSHDEGDNDVSRLVTAVLRRFGAGPDREPTPYPAGSRVAGAERSR
ncbi:hypothetical protein FHX81_0132 [Saccharothrix saharensis]|uniref:N,N-dimethylformamidase beta subunit-like C-terminal domain-containing protein n=1 Tax=Saccharothrix saharensis TaxID=571190 RepID=A0A543J4Z0_9PSEU|nr:N,N-dimethylformamidase beta subunit family domain-containing protein [Saccharothrix saharensis]TQM77886.1 hypothetical protein FHX81_0132 [Saccharothrix saharensis]